MHDMPRTMLVARLPCRRTVVLHVLGSTTAAEVREMVRDSCGIPEHLQILECNGKKLDEGHIFSDCRANIDGCVINVVLGMQGGAAAKLKAEKERKERMDQAEAERQSWFELADKTDETGVMRLLISSQVLHKHKLKVHGSMKTWFDVKDAPNPEEKIEEAPHAEGDAANPDGLIFSSDPHPAWYDAPKGTGYPCQRDYDRALGVVAKSFFEHWTTMTNGGKFGDMRNKMNPAVDADASKQQAAVKAGKPFEFKDGEQTKVWRLIEATGNDGLWYKGPKLIIDEEDKEVWNLMKIAEEAKLWSKTGNCWQPPWMIDPENPDSDLERWIFGGIGTTTYYLNEKAIKGGKETINELVLWSQEDEDNQVLGGLNDREKLRLKQRWQIKQKQLNKIELTAEEDELNKLLPMLVEEGPMHKEQKGIFQWRIKSLKEQLGEKCVFWQNTEPDLPGGSIAQVNVDKVNNKVCKDAGYDPPPHTDCWNDDKYTEHMDKTIKGEGNEAFEFWKYGKQVGSIKKKWVREDRHRLLDTIEMYTPTYKAVIKYQGRPADEKGENNHQMLPKMMREITDIVALALDLNLPDFPEDKIALFVKSLIDERVGPTWHVLVGRSFGFSIQSEARHFLHLHMQHLAVVIWKYEPDPPAAEIQAQA